MGARQRRGGQHCRCRRRCEGFARRVGARQGTLCHCDGDADRLGGHPRRHRCGAAARRARRRRPLARGHPCAKPACAARELRRRRSAWRAPRKVRRQDEGHPGCQRRCHLGPSGGGGRRSGGPLRGRAAGQQVPRRAEAAAPPCGDPAVSQVLRAPQEPRRQELPPVGVEPRERVVHRSAQRDGALRNVREGPRRSDERGLPRGVGRLDRGRGLGEGAGLRRRRARASQILGGRRGS
mmetsp:Transcript_66898/g.193295  ORF Transcript_66898/g.193295 Transcript_66898/m.193295 type:complete len:237 (+) Transcript_66898:793-1503(+)